MKKERSLRRGFIAGALILAIALVEMGAAVFLGVGGLWPEGGFLAAYRDRVLADPAREALTAARGREDFSEDWAAHPYFGVVSREEGARHRLYDLPKRESPSFVAAILGGSVASQFAKYAERDPAFRRGLERLFARDGRPLLLLNLAVPSSKQPQQFSVAAHHTEQVHLFINIDGVNEVLNDLYPDYALEFPLFSPVLFPRGERYLPRLAKLYLLKRRRSSLARLPVLIRPLAYSPAIHILWRAADRLLERRIGALESALRASRDSSSPVFESPLNEDQRGERLAAIWKKYTGLQYRMLKAEGIDSFYFVQPTPLLAGSKPLTRRERRIIRTARPLGLARRYPPLLKKARALKTSGVPVFDLTEMFSGTAEDVYEDSCCHLNETGSRLLGEKILAELSAYRRSRR